MRYLIILLFIFNLSFGDDLKNKSIVFLFKHNYFSYLCNHRWDYINKYLGKREDLLSLVGYSCLKKHWIIPALDVAKALRFTKMGRINSSYITSLFAIKIFLIRYIEDNFNIKDIKVPSIEGDDLGRVFILAQKNLPIVRSESFILKTDKGFIKTEYKIKTGEIILSFYDKKNNLIRKEKYW